MVAHTTLLEISCHGSYIIPKNDYYQFFLSNICFVCVKETSQGDVSFMHSKHVFLYPQQTLFVVGILFSRCPCVRASVRPSVRNALFP